MIDKTIIKEAVEAAIAETEIFLVDIRVSGQNDIVVEIDSPDPLDLETVAEVSRKIEAALDRDAEDFSLEVGSAGLTAPFKVRGQWLKNVGNEIEVLTRDGKKFSGQLVDVTDDGHFTVDVPTKVRVEGKKRPETQMVPTTMAIADVKRANYLIDFK